MLSIPLTKLEECQLRSAPRPTELVRSTLSAKLVSRPSFSPLNLSKGDGYIGSLPGVQHLEREVIPFPHLDEWVDARSLNSWFLRGVMEMA